MAFPTGTGGQQSLGLTLNEILARAALVKQRAIDEKATLTAQSVTGLDVFALCEFLVSAKAYMAARAAVPGLPQYAKDVFNNQSLNIVAEYNVMVAAIDTVLGTIDTQTPSALAGTAYTPGATTTFRAQLQALADSID